MIEVYRKAKIIIISGDQEEIFEADKICLTHKTTKGKQEVIIQIFLSEKGYEIREKTKQG